MISVQAAAAIERCSKGLHELSEANRFNNYGVWYCRACWRDRSKAVGMMPLSKRSPTYEEWKAGAKLTCRHGHELLTQADFRLPAAYDLKRNCTTLKCCKCIAASHKKCKAVANYSEQTIRRILALIELGASKAHLAGRYGVDELGHRKRILKGVTDVARFNNWLKHNPKIAKVLEPKLKANAKANIAASVAKRRQSKLRISASSNVLELIEGALPGWLDIDQRADVTSAMYLALADGHLKKKDIKARAADFIRANNKQSDNIGRFGFTSLDAPMGDDNPASRIERLTDADRLWQAF